MTRTALCLTRTVKVFSADDGKDLLTDTHIDRHRDRKTDTHTHTDRHRDRQTHTQTQTDRQTDDQDHSVSDKDG